VHLKLGNDSASLTQTLTQNWPRTSVRNDAGRPLPSTGELALARRPAATVRLTGRTS
jgi:hypothetical protein